MMGRTFGFWVLVILPLWTFGQTHKQDERGEKPGIVPGIMVVKVKGSPSNLRTAGSTSPLHFIEQNLSTLSVEPALPSTKNTRISSTKSGLERVYVITLDESEDVLKNVEKLKFLEGIEYVEPMYENFPLYITNDPYANPTTGSQYYLKNIKAYEAWDIEKGDTNVVVGVVDTGLDFNHADLVPNVYKNHADPINGIDDDQDGYIDNYLGWDMADNDNDANSDTNGHGNLVGGISSAKTNNGIGIAGIGFNSRILPVKIMENVSGKLRNEYSAIIYAANQGVKVINLSWGSPWGYSKFAQDVINYAVLDRDVVVVAAAGNTSGHIDFYPASFDNVLSVTASDSKDGFATWATHSYKVDIMAPGQSIFSTKSGGSYGDGGNGTSYASPMVAGAAALVRSKYPHLDARQVMERLRVTSDDVYSIGNNSAYTGKIGKGRLNIQKALTDTISPSLRLQEFQYVSNFNDYIFPGDTIKIFPTFINYLREAKNVKIRISSADTNSLYSEKEYQFSSMKTYESKGTGDSCWEVILAEKLLPNTRVYFRIDYEANGYKDFEYFYIDTNPTYFDVENNGLLLTVSSDGDLGYDRDSFNWGNGVWLNFEKISNYMGLIVSRDRNYVADNVVNNYAVLTKDKDFKPTEYARLYKNSMAAIDARSKFTESDNLNKLGIEIEQKILGWNDHPENNFFVIEYRIVNRSQDPLDSLNMSFYADYDLKEKQRNTAEYDPDSRLSYTYNRTGGQLFAGLSLITGGDSTAYSIDLMTQEGNEADFMIKFPDTLKHKFSTSSFEKVIAGGSGSGNDVANLVGVKNLDLQPGQSRKVTFVILAGTSLESLKSQLERAKLKYEEYLQKPPVDYYAYSCEGGSASLYPKNNLSFEIFEDANLMHRLDSGNAFHISSVEIDTNYYVVEVNDGIREDVRRASVLIKEPIADFLFSSDTLLISEETLDTLHFHNNTPHADTFAWDFGNGYFSKVSDPIVQFETAGHYNVKLVAQNSLGCSDTISKALFVAERSEKPLVNDALVCKGSSVTISASNTSSLRVYLDKKLSQLYYEGDKFVSGPVFENMDFYFTNTESYESLPVKVAIKVSDPGVDFKYSVTVEGSNQLLKLEDKSISAHVVEWQINNQFLSHEPVLLYDYSEDDVVDVTLSVFDSLSCQGTKILSITPSQSPDPVVQNIEVCSGGTAVVSPEGGSGFLFYSDSQKTNLLATGSSFAIGPIYRDTVVFVSNIDSLLESNLVAVTVSLTSLKARATARPDSINLSETDFIEITNTSIGAETSYFIWPSGSIDTIQTLTQFISDPGTYTYTVVAKANNCIDTASVSVYAYLVTSVDSPWEIATEVAVYPNPAVDYLNVNLGKESRYRSMELRDERGTVVFTQDLSQYYLQDFKITTSHLANGIYLLRLHGDKDIRVLKVAIN